MAGWIGFPSAGEEIVLLDIMRQNFHWPSARRFIMPRFRPAFDAAAGLIQRARAVNHSLRDKLQDARILDYFGTLSKTAQTPHIQASLLRPFPLDACYLSYAVQRSSTTDSTPPIGQGKAVSTAPWVSFYAPKTDLAGQAPSTLRPAVSSARETSCSPRPATSISGPPEIQNMRPLTVMQHVRRMRGGSQAQLLRASDSHLYVVKFTNNPQGVRILANDWIASRLARRIGLPVPEVAAVDISQWLIRSTPELSFELSSGRAACHEGVHFGSRFAVNPQEGMVTDLLPAACLPRVKNLAAFIGAVVLDKWTCNTDRRQAVFVGTPESAWYSAVLVDQGHCFNATYWDFPDSPLYGLYEWREVYLQVTSWESFEPWLTCVESLDPQEIWEIADSTSPAWYDQDALGLAQLVSQLILRQRRLRRIIADLKHSAADPFRNWRQSASSYPAASSRALPSPVTQIRSNTGPINQPKP